MNTHITTMRYALEIATLSRLLEEKERHIQMLQDTIAIKDEQLATQNSAAMEYVARCNELEARNSELARQRDLLALETQERRAA
ncbi:hypothetical protein B0T37_10740 [Chromobacterium violaceum]|uniref:hypothetical protein n=1 Tax=Chromobacterium violaceum TaxID=536 RepID=UPI0009D9E8EE|nr:hypothetical protein [Chromobacterium violaceum]OQS10115.1 hypothetical protein B0T38_11135 [Chromobacterium violaceum]OQS26530.1 hypothetical protein B0T37_10740 [Chromobacterium violaceum]